jgi:hypothetical protein
MAANIDGIAEPMRFDELSAFDGVAQSNLFTGGSSLERGRNFL